MDAAENVGYLDSLTSLKPTCAFEFGDRAANLVSIFSFLLQGAVIICHRTKYSAMF